MLEEAINSLFLAFFIFHLYDEYGNILRCVEYNERKVFSQRSFLTETTKSKTLHQVR